MVMSMSRLFEPRFGGTMKIRCGRTSGRVRWGARAKLLVGGAVLALGSTLVATPADAGVTIPSLPRTTAATFTPRVIDDAVQSNAGVYELRQIGSTMYAGGRFNTVQNAARTLSYTRTNLFAFNAGTGVISTTFHPSINGSVWAMEPSADGRYLYIGGDFNSFNGTTVKRLVKLDLQTNQIDTTFRSTTNVARISDLQLVNGRLFASGTFPGGIP